VLSRHLCDGRVLQVRPTAPPLSFGAGLAQLVREGKARLVHDRPTSPNLGPAVEKIATERLRRAQRVRALSAELRAFHHYEAAKLLELLHKESIEGDGW